MALIIKGHGIANGPPALELICEHMEDSSMTRPNPSHARPRHIGLLITLFTVAGIPGVVTQTAAADRTSVAMFRNGLDHSGTYAGSATGIFGGVLWRTQTGAPVRSSPTIVGNAVLIGSSDGHLYALDASTGYANWAFTADGAIASSPAVAAERVFFATYNGTFYAVNRDTGHLLWKTQFGPYTPTPYELKPGGHTPTFNGDFILSSAAVVNDTVVVGGGDGQVHALSARSGKPRWTVRTEGRIRSSPAISDGVVYVGSFDGSLYAIDFTSGKVIWRYDTKGRLLDPARFDWDRRAILSSPAVADGVVYFGSRDSHLYAVDAAKGTLKWMADYEKDGMTWAVSSPAVHDQVVYSGTADGHFVHALRAMDGHELWRFTMPDRVWSSPVIAGSQLYITNQSGSLYAVDLKSGKESWHYQTRSSVQSSPAVANGVLYFGSSDGGVYAIRADGAQPMQRAVYFDAAIAKQWASFGVPGESEFRDFFQARGYDVVDSATLEDWLTRRVADRAPSVLVAATSALPPAVAGADPAHGPFRQYLESGGKVVWSGINPPLLFDLKFDKDNKITDATYRWDDAGTLLGISYKGGLQNNSETSIATPAGRDWGLPTWWLGTWDAPISSGMTVLGQDDRAFANAWVKSYGGPPGTGFVYVGLMHRDSEMLNCLAMVAEYRPKASARQPKR
jgi:outer membrane protein assembly factor BamB